MSVDEYAALELRLGTPLVRTGGVWWRRVRPLFWRPLFPFAPLPPGVGPPSALARLGGWQYAVAAEAPHDSHLNFMVFRNPQGYGQGRPSREDRNNLRRARNLAYRRIDDLEELATEGHRVLREFFARTRYGFRRDRLRPAVFRRWATALLADPRVLVLGAYSKAGLCEVHVSFRVADILFFEVSFASHEGRARRSTYGVLDHLRRLAAETDARLICAGPATGKRTLDDFKLRRGAKILSLPSRLHISPLARGLLGLTIPATLARLRGMDEAAAAAYSEGLLSGQGYPEAGQPGHEVVPGAP